MTETVFAPQHHAVDAWRRETFAPGTPADVTITERRLWAVNPQDHKWRAQYLHEIPDWLTGSVTVSIWPSAGQPALPGKGWQAWPVNPGENWKNNWRL